MLPPACDMPMSDIGQAITEGALLGLYTLKKYKSTAGNDAPDNLRDFHILATTGSASKILPRALNADVFWQKQ